MDTNIVINRDLLKPHIKNITPEEIINILNNIPFIKSKKDISSNIGKIGEQYVYDLITNFEKKNISQKSYSGDFLIWKKEYPNIVIMIEVKNYTSSVPLEQYEKFIRDLEINKFSGGIFVSSTPISGLMQPLVQSNIIILYNKDAQLVNLACETLWLKIYEQQYYCLSDTKYNIQNQCKLLNDNIELLVEVKINALKIQKTINKNTNQILQKIEKNIIETRNIVNYIIMNLEGTKQYIKKIPIIFDNDFTFENKETIENFINSNEFLMGINIENICISNNKNIIEITYIQNNKPRKFTIKHFKTKIEISFIPIFKNNIFLNEIFNCNGVSFNNGNIMFIIDKNNIKSTIYDIILKFW